VATVAAAGAADPLEVLWLRWMRRKVEREVRSLRERSADVSSFLVETCRR
jgi:ATP-binding cassette subfamily B protein